METNQLDGGRKGIMGHDGKNYQPDIPGVGKDAPEAFPPFQAPLETRPNKGGASTPLQPAAPGTTQEGVPPTPAP